MNLGGSQCTSASERISKVQSVVEILYGLYAVGANVRIPQRDVLGGPHRNFEKECVREDHLQPKLNALAKLVL